MDLTPKHNIIFFFVALAPPAAAPISIEKSSGDPRGTLGLTFKESQDFLHWSEATEALEAGESDGHLRLVVVVWIVLRKLSMETSS